MKLSYIDLQGDGERHTIEATITTNHPASSYGQAVIVTADGLALDLKSWVMLDYQVVEATPDERAQLANMFDLPGLGLNDTDTVSQWIRREGGTTPGDDTAKS